MRKERTTVRLHPDKREKIERFIAQKHIEQRFELTLSDAINFLIDRGFEKEGFENE